jgi:RNA polymerase sigma-70 factor (sigma-E family)
VSESFEEFVAVYGAPLGRLCHQLTGSHDAALDLVQDVLERVYVKWSRVSRAEQPFAYVRRLAVNTHLNSTRRRVPTLASDPAVLGAAVPPAPDGTETVAAEDELWRALALLPARQRAALVLRYYEDCADAQIAEALGCRPATVRSLVARGLAALRASDLTRSEP